MLEGFLLRQRMTLEQMNSDWNNDQVIVFHRFFKCYRHGKTDHWTDREIELFRQWTEDLRTKSIDFFTLNCDRLQILLDFVKWRDLCIIDMICKHQQDLLLLLRHEKRHVVYITLQILNRLDPNLTLELKPEVQSICQIIPTKTNKTYFVLEPRELDAISIKEAIKLELKWKRIENLSLDHEKAKKYLALFSDHDSELLEYLLLSFHILPSAFRFELFLDFLDIIDFDPTSLLDIHMVDTFKCNIYLKSIFAAIQDDKTGFFECCEKKSTDTDYFLSFCTCFDAFSVDSIRLLYQAIVGKSHLFSL
jgi:DNA-directed RNA polymerase subunit F